MDNSGFVPRASLNRNITAIRPKTWNTIADVVNGGRVGASGQFSSAGSDGMGRGWVWIKNTSGSDRSRFECMALGDPSMALTTDGQVDVVFDATTADPVKSPAILLEPIADGRVGRAVIYGLCLAKVGIATAVTDLFAAPDASGNNLMAAGSGLIRLLTAPSISAITLMPVVLGVSASGSTKFSIRIMGTWASHVVSCQIYTLDGAIVVYKETADVYDPLSVFAALGVGDWQYATFQDGKYYAADPAGCPGTSPLIASPPATQPEE